MCRFMIYKGAKSMLMADLLTHPARSIVTQSYASRERVQCNPLNGDGFGVGWYSDAKEDKVSRKEDPAVPCVFTSITPAWNNINLKRFATKIRSPLIFAHVRAAYPGMLVSEANCHPFQFGRFLWMHNGGIGKFSAVARTLRESLRDDLYNAMQGSTDSEMGFMLFLNQLADPMASYSPEQLKDALIATIRQIDEVQKKLGVHTQEVSLLNFAVTDGCTVLATKWVNWDNHDPATLYFSSGTKFECDARGEYRMHREERTEQAAIVTSEPLTEDPKDWVPVPRNHLIMITPDMTVTLHPIDESPPPAPTVPLTSPYSSGKRKSEADILQSVPKKTAAAPSDVVDLPATHHLAHALTGNTKILTLELSADEMVLYAGSMDGEVCVWSLESFQQIRTLKGHTGSVLALLASGDRLLFSSSSDSTIRLWDVDTGECRATITDAISSVFALACAQNQMLFYGRQDCQVRALELTPLAATPNRKSLCGHRGYVFALVISRDVLYSAAGDGQIMAWDVNVLAHIATLKGHNAAVYSLAIWETELYSGSKDTTIKVWDTTTRNCVRTLGGHGADVVALAASQNFLYSSSIDGVVKVWDRRRLVCIQTLGDTALPRALALKTGKRYLAAARGQTVQVWDSIIEASSTGILHPPSTGCSASPLIATLGEFVAIKTVSGNPALRGDCYRGARFLHTMLTEIGAEARIVQNKNEALNPVVMGRLGNDPTLPTIVFYGHYDVVPANESNWSFDPFVMCGKDGYVYGRGVADNKGPIVATIFAVKELVDQDKRLPCNIVFIYEGEEECRSEGFPTALAENHAWFKGTEAIVITNTCWIGENVPCLIYGLRGLIEVEVEISGGGRDLHNGTEGGVVYEPYTELVALLAKLVDGTGRVLLPGFYDAVAPESTVETQCVQAVVSEEFSLDAYCNALKTPKLKGDVVADVLHRRWRQPNLSISCIEGSGASSRVISRKATAKISIRHVPNQNGEFIIKELETWLKSNFTALNSCNKLSVQAIQSGDWWLGDPQSKVYQAAARAVEAEWKRAPLFVREGGSIPLTPYLEQTLHAPVVHIPFSQASHRAHLENERMRVENLARAKAVILGFIREFCRAQPDAVE